MIDEVDYVKLGLVCADICTALDRGLSGRLSNELDSSACEAINRLTTSANQRGRILCANCLSYFPSQDCGGDPEGYRKAG